MRNTEQRFSAGRPAASTGGRARRPQVAGAAPEHTRPTRAKAYEIYTASICQGSPGPGGWAALICNEDGYQEAEGYDEYTTESRVAITAALRALRATPTPGKVIIHSDSRALVTGMTERGVRTSNVDLWGQLDEAAFGREVSWQWRRPHTGHLYGERADALAKKMAGVEYEALYLLSDDADTQDEPAQAETAASEEAASAVVPAAAGGATPGAAAAPAAPERRGAVAHAEPAAAPLSVEAPVASEEEGLRDLVPGFSHTSRGGDATMVDVSSKAETERVAVAKGRVFMAPETLKLIASGGAAKGDVLSTARLAGIMAAKRTPQLIPLCHPLPLDYIGVDVGIDAPAGAVSITATVRCRGRTGVEMEALTAVSIAALTVYDMAKSADRFMRIADVRLVSKSGGKSGDILLEEGSEPR